MKIKSKKTKRIAYSILLAALPTLLIWTPFFFRMKSFWTIPLPTAGMATIVSNYDGPLFLVVAKTFYNPELIQSMFQFPLPTEYYSAHFPLFPFLIKIFSFAFGYPYAMLFVTVASSALAIYFFLKFAEKFIDKKNARWLTFVFAMFPARWLIVRSVGSAEPLFLATTIASIYYFKEKKYLKAGIWGALAQLTKSAGILLFFAYLMATIAPNMVTLFTKEFKTWTGKLNLKKIYPILLIPISLILLFVFYGHQYGDFFAYFNSGDNIHLFFPPFQIFNYSAPWVGTFWLEEIIFIYLIGGLGLAKLIEKKEILLSWFVGIFFVSILFVSHRDLLRYSLPVIPFLISAFSGTLTKKEFKYAFLLIIIPIYLFSLSYISQNTMPISNWTPFL